MIKLWLDDIRNPAAHAGEGWTWARTAGEAIELLATRDVAELSLDYDLVPEAYGCEPCQHGLPCPHHVSGVAVVAYLVANPARRPRAIRIHSRNPAGSLRMARELAAHGMAVA